MSRRLQDEEIVIGFRARPTPREERRALQDRDYMEKLRLAARREDFGRYDDPGYIGHAAEGSALYCDDHHRFGDDFLEMERRAQREKREKYNQFLQARSERLRGMDAYAQREDEARKRAEEERLAMLQARGNAKNRSGANYDLVTHEYLSKEDAEAEQKEDDMIRWRAEVRRAEIARKGGYGYNPLTGEYMAGLEPRPMPR